MVRMEKKDDCGKKESKNRKKLPFVVQSAFKWMNTISTTIKHSMWTRFWSQGSGPSIVLRIIGSIPSEKIMCAFRGSVLEWETHFSG